MSQLFEGKPIYSLFIAIAISFTISFWSIWMREEKWNLKFFPLYIILGFISTLLCAGTLGAFIRIVFNTKAFSIVAYGGVLGFILYSHIYFYMFQIKHSLLDSIYVCIPLFHSISRWGCFCAGCCYGIPSNFALSVSYEDNISRFPVQLLESIFLFIIFLILFLLLKRNIQISILKTYLVLYASGRFFIEYLRGDPIRGIIGYFSISQIISLIILSCLLITSIKRYTNVIDN